VQRLTTVSHRGAVALVRFINRRLSHSSSFKDADFSRATVTDLWEAGRRAVRRSIAHPDWLNVTELASGVRIFDLAR
jgi:NTE family protein